MAQTISGGFYADAAGTLRDANGVELDKDKQAEAKKLAAEQVKQKAEAERLYLQAEAQRDPLARALGGYSAQPDLSTQIADLNAQIAELKKAGK
jgi:hypothetical protein